MRRQRGRRGQAAVMDALFFMLVCSGAAVLLFSIAGAYNTTTNRQITALYNYEYAQTALVSLHYAKDADGSWFWNRLREALAGQDPAADVKAYLNAKGKTVWDKLADSSPSPYLFLCFETEGLRFCTPDKYTVGGALWDEDRFSTEKRPAYAAGLRVQDAADPPQGWTVLLKQYY